MVHTLKGCPACDELKRPNNFAQFKDLVLKASPDAKIEIFEHPSWGTMTQQEKYPKFGIIRWAPTIMVTDEENMSSKGDPTKIRILNGKYNASAKTLEKITPEVAISKGLPPLIKEVLTEMKTISKPTAIIPPVDGTPPKVIQPSQVIPVPAEPNPTTVQGKVKCKFTLVSYR